LPGWTPPFRSITLIALLTINSITITGTNSGDFAQTNNCPTSSATLAANSSCTIIVMFKPSVAVSESAAVSISSNAAGSPQVAGLQGVGIASGPVGSLSPTALAFGNQTEGTSSAPQTLTLRNTGNAALTINSITIAGTNSEDFAQTNNCPTAPVTLAVGGSCSINVTFTPSAAARARAQGSLPARVPRSERW